MIDDVEAGEEGRYKTDEGFGQEIDDKAHYRKGYGQGEQDHETGDKVLFHLILSLSEESLIKKRYGRRASSWA